jgi:hypothetical protein
VYSLLWQILHEYHCRETPPSNWYLHLTDTSI